MAITTAAQAITEINATNLVDGQQIKQLLADLSTWIATLGGGPTITPQAGPTEMTSTTGGTVSTAFAAVVGSGTYAASDITNLSNGLMSVNGVLNSLITKLVASGVLTST